MPTGTGAVSLRNLPNVPYVVNPSAFFTLTERNEFQPVVIPIAAPNQFVPQTLLQVGVVAKLRLSTTGSMTLDNTSASAAGVTPSYLWPYGIFGNIQLSGNGQNNFQNVDGLDYQIRTLIQQKAYVDDVTSASLSTLASVAASTSVSAPFTVEHSIPVAIDMTSLVGSLYAQTEATELTLRLGTESLANLVSGTGLSFVSLTGQCSINEVFFDVPYDPSSSNKVLVVPDLTVLHGIIAQRNQIGAQSQGVTNLPRQNGQLERLWFWTDNSNVIMPTADYSYIRLTYGSKHSPYDYENPLVLRAENNEDYRNALTDGIFVMDFIKENPQRDVVLLQGVTNLRLETGYSTLPGVSAYLHYTMETLFA